MTPKEEFLQKVRDLIEGSDLFTQSEARLYEQLDEIVSRIGDLLEDEGTQYALFNTLAPGWFLTQAAMDAEMDRRYYADNEPFETKAEAGAYIDEVVSRRPYLNLVPEDKHWLFTFPFRHFGMRSQALRELARLRERRKADLDRYRGTMHQAVDGIELRVRTVLSTHWEEASEDPE